MSATIVVAGALANKPGNGGEAWVVLSWVRGLRALGFDVWFVEELGRVEPHLASSLEGMWFESVTQRSGMHNQSILIAGNQVLGADDIGAVRDLVAASALVVNISGNLRRMDVLGLARLAAYVDLDPGFTQIWHAKGLGDLGLQRHQLHFTVGECIGTSMCPVPTSGVRWMPTRQPVILSDWADSPVPADAAFTTVATWRCAFGPLEWDGVEYGLKVHEFRRIVDLPGRVSAPLELALAIHDGDAHDGELLAARGWRLRNAHSAAGTPELFRAYIEASLGEFSVAQGVYSHARTGWFSDRTARYLASGRPAVVQDTGLGRLLPIGEGLLTFHDLASAAAAVDAVVADPERHGKAARHIAEQYFDAARVLTEFVDRCGVSP